MKEIWKAGFIHLTDMDVKGWKKRFGLPLLICGSALLAGCNSLNWHAEGKAPRVYPGVSMDCEGLADAHSTGMYAPFIYTYSAVDMPFSLIVDTLYLPSDMLAVRHQNQRDFEYGRTNKVVPPVSPNAMQEPTANPRSVLTSQ